MCVIGARELRAGLYPGRIRVDLEREREGERRKERVSRREEERGCQMEKSELDGQSE